MSRALQALCRKDMAPWESEHNLRVPGTLRLLADELLEAVRAEHFADVDVAARVGPDRVRRALGRVLGEALVRPPREQLAVRRPHRDLAAAVGDVHDAVA